MRDTLKHGDRGGDVRQLQTFLNALGENIAVDGIFGDITFHAVCDFQTVCKLEPDGVVGPKTWQAITDALERKKHEPKPAPKRYTDEDLRLAGELAVRNALDWWKLDIYDPEIDDDSALAHTSKHAITQFIREGLCWTWEPEYAGDGDFEWCLAFVAKCWERLKKQIRIDCIASTHRVDRYGAYRELLGKSTGVKPETGAREYGVVKGDYKNLTFDPRPGDILLVGKKGYGTHGCLVESYDAATGVFRTIEGNAFGQGPNGERQQGVVRFKRGIGQVRRIVRPGVDDLV